MTSLRKPKVHPELHSPPSLSGWFKIPPGVVHHAAGFAPVSISPVFRFVGIATLLEQLGDQGGPTGLMAGS